MVIILPVNFILLTIICFKNNLRISLLTALAILTGAMVCITEVMGIFKLFSYSAILVIWCCVTVGQLILIILKNYFNPFAEHIRTTLKSIKWSFFKIIAVSILVVLGTLSFVIASVAAPNNWDSMAYHLPRVMQWIQQHSLAYFSTPDLYQLFHAPGSEIIVANIMLLTSGSDQWVNLAQWVAYIGCAIASSLIAQKFGAAYEGQFLAAIATLTVPMAFLQSSTTQNDLLVSLWILTFITFVCLDLANPDWRYVLLAGLSVGLAMSTKPTAYIFAGPFLLVWVIIRFWRFKLKTLGVFIIAGSVAISLCLPYWDRNWQLFGNPLGPQSNSDNFFNSDFTLQGLSLNVFRNLGTHIMLPEDWVEPATRASEMVLGVFHLNLNDTRYTRPDHAFVFSGFNFDEDRSGNTLHLIFILLLPLLLLFNRRLLRNKNFLFYLAAWIATLLIMSIIQRWQAYQSRYHLPWFLLAAPIIGMIFEQSKPWVKWSVISLLFVGLLPYIWFNPTKPLWTDWNIFNLPRREVMMRREDMLVDYVQAQEMVIRDHDCFAIGMVAGEYDWEYPLWTLWRDAEWRTKDQSYELHHILVQNVTASLEDPAFTPCAVLVTASNRPETIAYHGSNYSPALQTPNIWVYLPDKQ